MADNSVVQTIKDAEADARSLSEFLTKSASFKVSRRLAPTIHTLDYYLGKINKAATDAEMRADQVISNVINSSGFIPVGTFAGGATLSKPNDVLKASDGKLYRWAGDLPKVVPASSTPESTGGFGSNAWLEVSDASLAQKLAGLGGASTIGSGVSVFNNMAEFLAAESQIQDGSKVFLHSMYQGLDLEGEGCLYTYSKIGVSKPLPDLTGASSVHEYTSSSQDKVSLEVGSGFLNRDFDGKVFLAEFGASGVDYDNDSHAFQLALDCIRNNQGGVLSMGVSCTYYLEGIFTANCSNIDWQFNNSKVYVGMFLVKWHPYKTGRGNYENIKISNATWVGNTRPKYDRTGYVHMDFVLCDGINITGCTYIEATYAGHNVDLMGCREVTFEGNYVLGSCLDFSERWHSESVQISDARAGGAGTPIDAESIPFFSGDYNCSGIYFRKNTYKPYINPITGIKTYPPRPIGNHLYTDNENIEIIDNHFEDIIRLNRSSSASGYTSSIISFGFAGDVTITGNNFISKNGNYAAIYLNGFATVAENEGFTPVVNVSDNNFNFKGLLPDQPYLTDITLIRVGYEPTASTKETNVMGARIDVKSNEIYLDATNSSAEIYNVIGLVYTVNNCYVNVSKNKLRPIGKASSFIKIPATTTGYRRGGSLTISNNYVGDTLDGFAVDIVYNPVGAEYDGHDMYIWNNILRNQWRTFKIQGSGVTDVKGNRFIGGSDTSSTGVTSDYFRIVLGYHRHLSLSDNIVYADNEARLININNVGHVESEAALEPYEFRRVD